MCPTNTLPLFQESHKLNTPLIKRNLLIMGPSLLLSFCILILITVHLQVPQAMTAQVPERPLTRISMCELPTLRLRNLILYWIFLTDQ